MAGRQWPLAQSARSEVGSAPSWVWSVRPAGSSADSDRFGAALGNTTITTNGAGQIVMTRKFANATLTLNTTTKEVTYTGGAATAFAPAPEQPPLRRRPPAEDVIPAPGEVL